MYQLGSETSRQICRVLRYNDLNWSQQCPQTSDLKNASRFDRTASAILDAAAHVFSDQGTAANLAEIAAAAGVSRATLYRYYPNREALLRALGAHALNELASRLNDAGLAHFHAHAAARGVAASVATADTFPGPGSYTHGIYTSNGDVYTYGVYVPSSYLSGQHVPLLVMIHDCNTPADVQALTVEYDSLAEQHDFIVLYPEGDAADLAAFHCSKAFWAPQLEGRAKGDAAAIAGMT
jgi:AcrR family transcriptional regulator